MTDKLILIVDDEADIRQTLKDIIETIPARTIEAEDGEQCVMLAKENRPSLILLDVMMPGLKTKDILQKLSQQDESKNIPVVLVTVMRFSETQLQELVEHTQVVNYVAKPFDISRIIEVVQELLR